MGTLRDTHLARFATLSAALILACGLALGPIGCGSDDPVQDAADENAQEFEENVEQQAGQKAEDAEEAVDEINERMGEAEDAQE